MYTPPQDDDDTLSRPHTYLFQPVGIGRRERREQWVWKSEIREPSRAHHPVSYQYVIEDGKLPTISVHHPSNGSKDDRVQRKLSKKTKRPPLERHSSPAAPGYNPQPPASPTSTGGVLKRALSLASIRVHRPSFEEVKKDLPPVPRIDSVILSDAMKPTLEQSFFDETDTDVEAQPKSSVEIPPRSPRRSSVTNPMNATPRIPKAPRISPQPMDSKEDMISPIALRRGSPDQPNPAQLPHQPSGNVSSATPKLSLDTRPVLRRQRSKFIEHIESPRTSVELPPQPRAPTAENSPPEQAAFSAQLPPKDATWKQLKAVKNGDIPKLARTRQLSFSNNRPPPLPSAASIPRRAATVKMPVPTRSTHSNRAEPVWTAEAMPVLMYPIVASGTARLVSC